MPSERIQRRIDQMLDEADQAIATSAWDTVRDRARNVLALDPTNPDARHYLGAAERPLIGPPANGFPLTPALSQREREPESEPSPPGLCLTHISGISGGGLGKVVAAEQVIEVLQTAP